MPSLKDRMNAFQQASSPDAFDKTRDKTPPRVNTGGKKLDTKALGAKLFNQQKEWSPPEKKKPINLTESSGPITGKVVENRVSPMRDRPKDWALLYELALQYDNFKAKEADAKKKQALSSPPKVTPGTSPDPSPEKPVAGPKKDIRAALEATMGGNYTAKCDWLDQKWITDHLVDDPDFKNVIFRLGDPKLFKKFDRTDEANRDAIITKMIDELLKHPKSKEITTLDLSNCLLPDKFLEVLSEQCSQKKGLPKLAVLNLETNLIQGSGVIALAKSIEDETCWKYLQFLMLENQKKTMTSDAEATLATAIESSPSIVVCSLRVRGAMERKAINDATAVNIDLLRQARRQHAQKTGTLKERKRNAMEQFFDKVADNTPEIKIIDIVGDTKFISLKSAEKTKACAAFASNSHITKVKLVKLGLDDDAAKAFGKSLETNTTLEQLVLDSNNLSGEGIRAIFAGLAKNSTITELQVRHQSKKMASIDEAALPELLEANTTIIKLGVDARDQLVKTKLDKKTNANREHQRKLRAAKKSPSK